MTVRVVTDSTADLPPHLVESLGITVVPLNIHFGQERYRDRIDITEDEFYERLLTGSVFPTTTQPSPGAFVEVYRRLAEETDAIISIHIAAKLSGTLNSTELARGMLEGDCRIELVDTLSVSMGEGMTVLAAARAAQAGAGLDEVLAVAQDALSRVRILVVLDTLEYLQRGGRIGRAQAFLGSLLNVKPILTVQDGEFHPVARVRTRSRAIERLYEFVRGFPKVEELSVVYSTGREDAEAFFQRLEDVCPPERFHLARFGPVLGTHAGPRALAVGVVVAA